VENRQVQSAFAWLTGPLCLADDPLISQLVLILSAPCILETNNYASITTSR